MVLESVTGGNKKGGATIDADADDGIKKVMIIPGRVMSIKVRMDDGNFFFLFPIMRRQIEKKETGVKGEELQIPATS